MLRRFLTIEEVAEKLERHEARILEAIEYGELPVIWSVRQRVIPDWALPPRRRVSEEEG